MDNKSLFIIVSVMLVILLLFIIVNTSNESFACRYRNPSYWSENPPYWHGNTYWYNRHKGGVQNYGMRIGGNYMPAGMRLPPNIRSYDLPSPYVEYLTNNDSQKPTITLYSMKGCPYCVQFLTSGSWDQLQDDFGDQYDFIIVDKNDAPDSITGFPTIVGPNNQMYDGNREYNDLKQWINLSFTNSN